MIIFDTDILSMFAKIDEVELLNLLFKEDIAVTPKIRDEIIVMNGGRIFTLEFSRLDANSKLKMRPQFSF